MLDIDKRIERVKFELRDSSSQVQSDVFAIISEVERLKKEIADEVGKTEQLKLELSWAKTELEFMKKAILSKAKSSVVITEMFLEKQAELSKAQEKIKELGAKDSIIDDDLVRIMNKIGNIKTQYDKFIGEDVQMWANIRIALAWELMPSRRAKEEQTNEQ